MARGGFSVPSAAWAVATALLLAVAWVREAECVPQYYPTQPRWDVESVILSRNGPSTTTSPRPTRWTTTTLRSFGVETLLGKGQSTVDELTNVIVNRPREVFKTSAQRSSKSAVPDSRPRSNLGPAAAVAAALVAYCQRRLLLAS